MVETRSLSGALRGSLFLDRLMPKGIRSLLGQSHAAGSPTRHLLQEEVSPCRRESEGCPRCFWGQH